MHSFKRHIFKSSRKVIVPPIVNAGQNITVASNETQTILEATLSTPISDISNIEWTVVSGPNTPNIVNSDNLTTQVTGLESGTYTFRIEVTNRQGLSDSDEVNVTRQNPSELIFNLLEDDVQQDIDSTFMREKYLYQVVFNPELITGASVSIRFDVIQDLFSNNYQNVRLFSSVVINKNNTDIFNYRFEDTDMNSESEIRTISDSQFSIAQNDVVTIELFAEAEVYGQSNNESAGCNSRILIKSATPTGVAIEVNNLPFEESARASAFSQ